MEDIKSKVGVGDLIYVGVHIRRSDLVQLRIQSQNKVLNAKFYMAAMQMWRKKLSKKAVFLVVSDSMEWCRSHITGDDVFHVGGQSPEVDLCLLANCNKTVVDYGTYSAWAAALAGGEAIIPDLSKDKPWPIKKIVL